MNKVDKSKIRDGVVSAYRELKSIRKVSKEFSVYPAIVSTILHEEGLLPERSEKLKEKVVNQTKPEPDACYYCRHFSRTSSVSGYCLTHRRSVRAKSKEHCFSA